MYNSIRDYEMSLWTLQDSFIAILKPSHIENQGHVEKPDVDLKNGLCTLKFSIPMYIYQNEERIENPIWYTTRNGNLIVDLRKIKVIFHKNTEYEQVFEFLITKVTESHEKFQLFCDVECESLAFHELGKTGYKLSLTEETYFQDWSDWADNDGIAEHEPHNNINYWCDKVFSNTNWTYEIQMDWSGYNGNRASSKIYEDAYAAAWQIANDQFIPSTLVEQKEKERLINVEESNRYNITQVIAETFGVYCRYQYDYDENYHIIARKVIFYNNFIAENAGSLDINYAYNTTEISRTMDSTDTITKMFVKTLNDSNTNSGLATIADTEANKSQEDYLLNFDYLYNIGTISREQYDEVNKYELKMHQFNQQLKVLEQQIQQLENELIDVSAAETIAKNAISLDNERISATNDLLNSITNNTSVVHVTGSRPDTCAAIEYGTGYAINLRQQGILPNTVRIYKTYTSSSGTLSNQISSFTLSYDEFNNLIKIINIPSDTFASADSKILYLTYDYEPQLAYENVRKTWGNRLYKDTNEYNKQHQLVESINNQLSGLKVDYDELLEQKTQEIMRFERLMGPAIREGYWQPDDEYAKYGEKHKDSLALTAQSNFNGQLASIGWDTELFDQEDKNYVEIGVTQQKEYYPCIKLNNLAVFTDYADNLSQISFIYQDSAAPGSADSDNVKYLRFLPIGSQSQLVFIRQNNNAVVPVLMLTGLSNVSYDIFDTTNYPYTHPRIGILTTDVSNGTISTNITELLSESYVRNNLIATTAAKNYNIVYPRIKINSANLKTSEDSFSLRHNMNLLSNYDDYYILSRTDNNQQLNYYLTIKPETIFKYGAYGTYNFLYELANSSLFIYLDAQQVLKENAYPKVSYEITPAFFNIDLIKYLYNYLNCIVHINDSELKFEYVKGYITELQLNLDFPKEDKIIVDNYKTKFEDLFSSIVVQTEQMQKNSTLLGMAAQAFTPTGQLQTNMIQTVMDRVDLNYAFNNGALTIDEANGIWGSSDSGIVAFRGGGIFTATEKDDNGDWIWNTGILPSGINADLITTGQLDTNLIRIFAGNDLKLQLNNDGLFAYRSQWTNDNDTTAKDQTRADGLDLGQYVVHNSDGLFLKAEAGTRINNGTTLSNDIDRVAISWDGLTLRNWNNEKTFYADPDTGNLTLSGTVYAQQLYISTTNSSQQPVNMPINEYINKIAPSAGDITAALQDLQDQIDGIVDTWFYAGPPTPRDTASTGRLPTDLEQEWGITYNNGYSSEALEIIARHQSDVYYDIGTPSTSETAGQAFRFVVQPNGNTIQYYWSAIADTATTAALEAAARAQAAADSKISTYYAAEKPNAPALVPDVSDTNFSIGDLWINTDKGNALYRYDGSAWALAGDSISGVRVEYATSTSASNPPTSGWSTSAPTWMPGQYIWSRTVTIKNGTEMPTNPICIQAAAARSISISGEQLFIQDVNNNNTITPASIVLNAVASNTTINEWYYKNGDNWISLNQGNASSYTVNPSTPANAWINNKMVIKVEAVDTRYYDIITIAKLTTGANGTSGDPGTPGAPASTVQLSNENISFSAAPDGTLVARTINVYLYGYTGTQQVTPVISNITNSISTTTIVAGTYTTDNTNHRIVIPITAKNATVSADSGEFTITVTSPINTILHINWTVIKAGAKGDPGATGRGIQSITEYYAASSSSTTTPSTWTTLAEAQTNWNNTNKYLWNSETVAYTNNTSDVYSNPHIVAIFTTSGTSGRGITSITNYYVANNTTSSSGSANWNWSTSITPVSASSKYLWNYESIIYTDGTHSETDPCIIGNYAADGTSISILGSYNTVTELETAHPTGNIGDGYIVGSDLYVWSNETNTWTNVGQIKGDDGRGIVSTTIDYVDGGTNNTTPPLTGWGSTIPSVAAGNYLWTRTTIVYTSGDNSISYSVAKQGETGPQGAAGKGINSITEYYAVSNSSSTIPSTWVSLTDAQANWNITNKYLWNSETITYTVGNADSYVHPHVVAIYTQDGAPGSPGAAGKGISTIVNYYLATNTSDASTVKTESGWTTTIQSVSRTKKYLWNYEIITYTSGNPQETDAAIIGMYAEDGTSSYTWIRYAPSASSDNLSPTLRSGDKYIGIAAGKTTASPTATEDVASTYTWAKIVGDDAITYYTWIKYAATTTPTQSTDFHDEPDANDKYIGIAYNQTSATESTNANDYTWSQIIGEKGKDGVNGTTLYTWIVYASDASGSNISTSPTNKTYIGIKYGQTSATPSLNANDYTFIKYIGDQGVSAYVYIRYAPTATSSDMSITKRSTDRYIGIANSTSATAPSTYSGYQWSLIEASNPVLHEINVSDLVAIRNTGSTISYTPAQITLSATEIEGDQSQTYNGYYRIVYENISGTTTTINLGTTTTYTLPTDVELKQLTCSLYAEDTYTTLLDTQTIKIIGDGAQGRQGEKGDNASIVFLTNENISFSADSTGKVSATDITCNVVAYNGITKVTPTVGTVTGGITNQLTITKNTDISNEIPLIIHTNANVTLNNQTSGTISIPISYPVTTTLSIRWTKISNGKGILSSTVKYAESSNGTTAPSNANDWKDSVPNVSAGNFLWTRTQTAYTDGTSTTSYAVARQGADGTSVTIKGTLASKEDLPTSGRVLGDGYIIGQDLWVYTGGTASTDKNGFTNVGAIKGADGESVTILSKSVEYVSSTNGTTAPSTGWSTSIPTVSPGNYLWTRTTISFSDGNDIISYSVSRNGTNGTNGYSTVIIYLYKRAATAPTIDWSNTLTYTFNTDTLNSIPTGWSRTIPTGTANLYVTAATASSDDVSDTIAYSEWTTPSLLSSNGQDGQDGQDGQPGFSSATIFLYKRSASAPSSTPINNLTYTFATGELTGNLENWSQTVPNNDGNPLYSIQATAISTSESDTIEPTEWSAPIKMVENGENGITYYTWIVYAASGNPSSTSTDIHTEKQPGDNYIGIAYNKTSLTPSTNANDYTWSQIEGQDGTGIISIVTEYYLSTSDQTQIGGSWSDIMPTYAVDSYYWTRSKITWDNAVSDPNHITYTTAVLAAGLNSANELANEANELATTTNSDFRTTSSQIYSEVRQQTESINALNSDLNTVVEQLSTTINQTANDINLSITELRQQQSNTASTAQEINEKMQEITTYMKFDTSGLSLGKTDSQLKVQLSNNELGFYDAEDKVAYINSNKMFITQAQITNQMLLGKYAFVPSGEHLALIYIG